MILFKEAAVLAEYLRNRKGRGDRIGFAPTMGALHDGHLSLIKKSKSLGDTTVASIFVNPTQFNDPADFEKYPVTIPNDILLLETSGCDILFMPSVQEIYPNGTNHVDQYDLGEVEFLLEGKYRPGHFQGVCQVVHRLLDMVKPDDLFMGQKDYQQCIVVKRLLQQFNLPVRLVTVPTSRESSGLAMSSRNLRLNQKQKEEASGMAKMLQYIEDKYKEASFDKLQQYATDYLLASGFTRVDYVSIADGETLQPVNTANGNQKLVTLIAAVIGEVRLIDNVVLPD
jgi:pantoate--beta-alanine ligase